MRIPSLTVLFAAMLLIGTSTAAQESAAPCAFPTTGWQIAAPDAANVDGAALETAIAEAEALPYLRSLLVVRNRCLVYEGYFGGATDDERVNSYSVTKSVTATLIGMAIAEGALPSANSTIGDFLDVPDDAPQAAITVDDLLKMLSGIDWDEGSAADIGGMLALNRHEVDYIVSLPMAHVPGAFWNYSTADSHLLSAMLTAATGESALDYATPRLFAPLGITDVQWTADIDGVNLGGTQLFWRPQDMAKFGLLILEDGEWDGDPIISQSWIDQMLRPQLRDPSAYALSYAAHWWYVYAEGSPPMFAAVGYGGQFILLAPGLNAVIVTTADSTLGAPGRYIADAVAEQRVSEVLALLIDHVLPAVDE